MTPMQEESLQCTAFLCYRKYSKMEIAMKSTVTAIAFALTTVAGAASAQEIDCSVPANAEKDACLSLPTVSSQGSAVGVGPLIAGAIGIAIIAGALGGSSSSNSTN